MAEFTCDSWRDTAGALWTPNRLAPIETPKAAITGAEWLIGTVTFRMNMSETHADPIPLNLFGNELANSP